MSLSKLQRGRRRVVVAAFFSLTTFVVWLFSGGLPIVIPPWAMASTKQAGQELFEHEWQPNDPLAHGDGLGPVYNAASCVACHFQGGVGGGGPNHRNVTAFEVVATRERPTRVQGVLHASSVDPADQETFDRLRDAFPEISNTRRETSNSGCKGPTTRTIVTKFDPVRTQQINTTALFGAGWLDRLSDRAIRGNWLRRGVALASEEFQNKFDAVPVGKIRTIRGNVGKFGWKGQFDSLDRFVAAACANEIGLGTPMMAQPRPIGSTAAMDDTPDLDRRQFAALVAFVDTLPRPVEILPTDDAERDSAIRGKEVFNKIGCAICHVPDLGGVTGVYSDFLLYSLQSSKGLNPYGISSNMELPPPIEEPDPEEWKTPPLWGVADSAPYFHDGGSPTLEAAILRHQGAAAQVTKAYSLLNRNDRAAVIAFLQTLKAPPAR
jgi:CxxC motif-containing protein (DUF1111 family)